MPSFDLAMGVIHLLIVIVHGRPLDACNRSVLIFDELEQRLLPSTKKSHLRMLINFRSLGIIKLLRPSTIDCATHSAGNPHQGGLRLQALAGGLTIACDVLRKIAFQEHGQVVML